MRKVLISVVAARATPWAAPAALAGERANRHYTVMCDGVAYESVDARAVELGGKGLALPLFPRARCTLAGPFNS